MELRIGISVTDMAVTTSKTSLVYELLKRLNAYIKRKKFGSDVLTVEVGFIMVFTKPGYEDWYKEKKPKYIEYKKAVSKLTGEIIETIKTIKYEVKMSDELLYSFINSDDDASENIIVNEAINSLEKLNSIAKSTDFELADFKAALINFQSEKK